MNNPLYDLTPDDVVALWDHLARTYHTTLVDKASADEMRLVADVLDALHIVDRERFLTRYTTTLGTRIYLPYTPGDTATGFSLLNQAGTAAHEHQHVVQFRTHPFAFTLRYLTDSAHRAVYEAEALGTSLEVRWSLTGQLPEDLLQYVGHLRDYACTEDDQRMAASMLEIRCRAIRQGGAQTAAGKVAVAFLKQRRGS